MGLKAQARLATRARDHTAAASAWLAGLTPEERAEIEGDWL